MVEYKRSDEWSATINRNNSNDSNNTPPPKKQQPQPQQMNQITEKSPESQKSTTTINQIRTSGIRMTGQRFGMASLSKAMLTRLK
jgi:hypothetical protein